MSQWAGKKDCIDCDDGHCNHEIAGPRRRQQARILASSYALSRIIRAAITLLQPAAHLRDAGQRAGIAEDKYKGLLTTAEKTFRVGSIDITDRDGNKETIKLTGGAAPAKPAAAKKPASNPGPEVLILVARRALSARVSGSINPSSYLRWPTAHSRRSGPGGALLPGYRPRL